MLAQLTKSLGVICPSCDFLNVAGAARCVACGSATDGVTHLPPKIAGAKPQPHSVDGSGGSAGEAVARSKESIDPQKTLTAEPPLSAPPGLKRANPAVSAQPRGAPVRPTFSSSAPTQPVPAVAGPKYGLAVLAGPSRGQRFRLGAAGAQVGRVRGAILFPDDPYLSPLHATLSIHDGKLYVRDESSTSGVYVSITNAETIHPNATFCAGLRLFRFVGALDPSPPPTKTLSDVLVYGASPPQGAVQYAVEEVMLGDRPGRCLLSLGPLTVGQGRCDFSYPNDEGLAPRHCELSPLPGGAVIRDLSSGLGTFVRVTGERAVKVGDRLRFGQQTLEVEALS